MKAIGTQTLITEDLVLRRFELSDAPAMFNNWAGRPDNVTYLIWPAHADLDVTQAILERWVAAYQDGGTFIWTITLKSQPNQVIGDISAERVIEHARQNWNLGLRTILFVDEIHRFNKAQQDAFLPHVESGLITLIGATTENPSFEVITIHDRPDGHLAGVSLAFAWLA